MRHMMLTIAMIRSVNTAIILFIRDDLLVQQLANRVITPHTPIITSISPIRKLISPSMLSISFIVKNLIADSDEQQAQFEREWYKMVLIAQMK